MAVQLLTDLTTVSSVADAELLLVESSSVHKAVTKANLLITHAALSGAAFTGDVTTTGKIGIGIPNPTFQLSMKAISPVIEMDTDDGSVAFVTMYNNSHPNLPTSLELRHNTGSIHLNPGNNLPPALSALPSGNVGIGTIAPIAQLEIKDSGASPLMRLSADNDNPWNLVIANNTSSAGASSGMRFLVNNAGDGSIDVHNGSVYKNLLLAAGGGNVGIGTDNPLVSFHAISVDTGNPTVYIVNSGTVSRGITVDGGSTATDYSAEFRNKDATPLMKIKGNGTINMSALATSSAGLVAGDLWNNGGVINIV